MKTATLNIPEKAERFFAKKLAFTLGPVELNEEIKEGGNMTIVDVRATEDFSKGHVPGAINLPEGQWNKLNGWFNERLVVAYCYSQTCHLAAHAAVEFSKQGHSVMEMEGGFEAWRANKLPVEK